MDALLSYLKKEQHKMLVMLEKMVEAESPSTDKAALDRFGKMVGDIAPWDECSCSILRFAADGQPSSGRVSVQFRTNGRPDPPLGTPGHGLGLRHH